MGTASSISGDIPYFSTTSCQLTATKVDRMLLELAAISVRYCLAQCFACLVLGTMADILDISVAFKADCPTPSFPSPPSGLFESVILE